MEHILQEPVKVIVPVRPVVDVLASFEKLYRSTARYHQVPGENEHYFRFQTVEGRCDYLLEQEFESLKWPYGSCDECPVGRPPAASVGIGYTPS